MSQEAKGVSLCAYLIGLAAFQKGLEVTYVNNPLRTRNLTSVPGVRGTVIYISDGEKGYYFNRSRGELTSQAVHRLSRNKWQAKVQMEKMNVSVPKGVLVDRSIMLQEKDYFSKLECDSLVVKPLSGSLGRGVSVGIKDRSSLENALNNISSDKIVIEQEVCGEEYRYYVANKKVVAVTGREPANVIGNGVDSIRKLVRRKNKERKMNPHLSSRMIKLDKLALQHLLSNSKSFDYIPRNDEKVYISSSANLSRGGDSVDATNLVSERSKQTAVKAANAIGIPNAGVDIINSFSDGEETSYVIELNSQAHIGSHTFPMKGKGQGNSVAESIVDSYFPNNKKRLLGNVFFDFSYVKSALQDGGASSITMPIVQQGWVKKRIEVNLANNEPKILSSFKSLLLKNGAFGKIVKYSATVFTVYLVGEVRSLNRICTYLKKLDSCVDLVVRDTDYPLILKVETVDHSKVEVPPNIIYKKKLVVTGELQYARYRSWVKRTCLIYNVKCRVKNNKNEFIEVFLTSEDNGMILKVLDLCMDGPKKSVVTGLKALPTKHVRLGDPE